MPSSPMPTMDSQRAAVQLAASDHARSDSRRHTEASALAEARGRFAPRGDPVLRRTHGRAPTAADRRRASAASAAPTAWCDYMQGARRSRQSIDATHPYADRSPPTPSWRASAPGSGWPRSSVPPGSARPAINAAPHGGRRGPCRRQEPRRVFLALGRQELHSFAASASAPPYRRLIDQPVGHMPTTRLLQVRGPFDFDAELRLLKRGADRRDRFAGTRAGAPPTPRSRRRACFACP